MKIFSLCSALSVFFLEDWVFLDVFANHLVATCALGSRVAILSADFCDAFFLLFFLKESVFLDLVGTHLVAACAFDDPG